MYAQVSALWAATAAAKDVLLAPFLFAGVFALPRDPTTAVPRRAPGPQTARSKRVQWKAGGKCS